MKNKHRWFHVMGVSHRQDQIADAVGNRVQPGYTCKVKARLIPDPDNRHDPNAIAVYIKRPNTWRWYHAGWIPSYMAANVQLTGTIKAKATVHEGDVVPLAVRLHIDEQLFYPET